MPDERFIVVFPSTHHALRAERIAREAGVRISMIPVPREVSSDCSMGMQIRPADSDTVEALLNARSTACRFVAWPK